MTWDALSAENASRWASWLWALLLAVWVLLWFGMKKAKKLESPLQRVQHVIPVTLGFWLMFGNFADWGWLKTRLLPSVPAFWMTGLLVTVLGIGIAIYARLSLGSNWSGMVTLKTGHELIRTGLYRAAPHLHRNSAGHGRDCNDPKSPAKLARGGGGFSQFLLQGAARRALPAAGIR